MKLKSKALLLDETIKLVSTLDANNNNNNNNNNKDDSPLSPIIVFKAGTILYETNSIARGEETPTAAAEAAASYESLAETFYQLLANLNRDYLTFVIFKDINAAFQSIVESSIGKLYTLSSTSSNSTSSNTTNSNNTLETLLSSIRAICGIYDALLVRYRKEKCVMPCAFDVTLCNTLAILYDHLMDREMNMIRSNATGSTTESTNTCDEEMENSMEELKTCILSILSSQILYGLFHPIIESGSLRESLNASTNTDTDTDTDNTSEDDTIQKIMTIIQTISDQSSTSSYTSTSPTSYCIGDLQKWQQQQKQLHIQNPQQYPIHHHRPIVELIHTMFTKNVDAQKEYLISVLQSASNSSDAKQQLQDQQQKQQQQQQQQVAGKHTNNKPKPKQKSAIKRLIEQVHTILPHLGEGYIEAALACYNHDIEITTNALMEDEYNNNQTSSSSSSSLHPRLRALDKSLPARKKESKEKYGEHHPDNGDVDVEEYEAKKIQKERIKEMEKTQEEEAYRLEVVMSTMEDTTTDTNTNTNTMEDNDAEYNDDYDDQYDGNGDDVGGADSGLYDVDYESIKAYNKIAKGMEEERKFWEGNANTNRSSNNNNKNIKHGKRNKKNGGDGNGNDGDNDGSDGEENGNEETGQKKYRGLDKGKGGRLIGPDGRYLPHPKSRKKGGGHQNQSTTNNNNNTNNTTTKNKKGTNAGSGTGATSKKGKTEKDKDGKKKDVELTKIQKRRKNDNKSKIGNHHRKERALKKSGGM